MIENNQLMEVWLIDQDRNYPLNSGIRYIPAFLPVEIVADIIRHGNLKDYPYNIPVQTGRNFGVVVIDDIFVRVYRPNPLSVCLN